MQPGQPKAPPVAAAAGAGQEGSQQVLGLMEQIVQQNKQLQEAVLEQRDQLSRQEVSAQGLLNPNPMPYILLSSGGQISPPVRFPCCDWRAKAGVNGLGAELAM
jgi:hypothetical protein